MKTYVLMISRTFPATHPRRGSLTCFPENIIFGQYLGGYKKHTIRANYEFWKKRIDKVQESKAELSLRYWSGKPRQSKQVEFLRLGKNDGVGIQKLIFKKPDFPRIFKEKFFEYPAFSQLSKNDGLSIQDFQEWFKPYDLSKPMAIIHFTPFRY